MIRKEFLCLLVATTLLVVGCSKEPTTQPSEGEQETPIVIDSETIGVTEEQETSTDTPAHIAYDFQAPIKSLFPLVEGYKWLYIGTAEYASIEVLNKIDNQHPEVTEIVIEGLIEDMSGLFLSDTTYLKQYSLFDHQLVRKFGPYESVVLKSPVNKGESWENLYFDPIYGLFDGRYLIREATENMVTVELTPISPEKDGVPEALKIVTVYEVGKGITTENRVYVYDYEGVEETYEFGYALYEEQLGGEVPFVSRYFSKDPYLSSIYHKGYFDYAIREALAYQFLYENRFRLTDSLLLKGYQSFVADLDKEDIRTIAVADNVLHIYAEKMDNQEALIGVFIDHYEGVIANNQFLLVDWFEEGQLEAVSTYNIEKNIFEIPQDLLMNDLVIQAKVALMNDNGMDYYFDNHQPIVKASSKYIGNNLYYLGDIPMQSYLTLLQQVYEKIPFYRDGLSTLTLDELQEFILAFEPFKTGYSDSYIGESATYWSQEFLYQYLRPSSMIYRIDQQPGPVHETSLVHYKKTLQQLTDTSQATILSMVIELIEKHHNAYSSELGNFLVEVGLEIPATYLQ